MRIDTTRAILSDLIAYPTISTDSNLPIIHYIADRLETVGAAVEVMVDESGHKANLFATLGAPRDGGLVLSGHSDVVPVTDQDWTSDPFDMTERDGKLYGRGACDMKGFIAACLGSLDLLAEAAKSRPIHFAFTRDEEVGCLGAQELVKLLAKRPVKPGLCIIGEPTSMQVFDGNKGCCEYTVRFEGLPGHSSAPEKGVNAVEYAVRYINRLFELRAELIKRCPEGSRFDPPQTTLNVGALKGGISHNVIAPRAELAWEMRPINATDMEFVKGEIASYVEDTLLPEMRAIAPEAGIATETIGEVVGLEPMDDNAARDLVFALTGQNHAGCVAFNTEAGLFQSLGMDAVICGPGSIEQAHKADEFVSLEQMDQALTMLGRLASART
ncbi:MULTISPECIES: acetylornithine deacetylase [Thioclava]|uniref:acetylornithine deacetylase n=1 Tax=Thioclava TaxID=285107 RepID=UPI000C4D9178|nr:MULTISPECIES: acetylornithine deacetylase [Thioclava]MAQ38610.1 acetylornithine deacetylase [Thioclava sp.]